MRVWFRQSVQTVTSFIYLVIVVYRGHSLKMPFFIIIIILDYVHTQREHIKTDDIGETTV
jgi:hypothetical protein